MHGRMRWLFAAFGAGSAIVLGAGAAQAAAAALTTPSAAGANLNGQFTVSETVTSDNGVVIETTGEHFSVIYTFTSSCASGACASALSASSGLTQEFTPTAATTYVGRGTAVTACYRAAAPHTVVVADGEVRTTTTHLSIGSVTGGAARSFTASIDFVYTPTSDGTAHHCKGASEVRSATGTGVVATIHSALPSATPASTSGSVPASTPASPAGTATAAAGPSAGRSGSGGDGVLSGGVPIRSSLARRLVPISKAFPLSGATVLDAAVAVGVMVLITFPSQLFNKTLDENFDDIREIVRRRAPPVAALRRWAGQRGTSSPWITVGMVIVVGSVLGGLNDPHFGVNAASGRTLIAVVLSFLIGMSLAAAVNAGYRRARHIDTAWSLHALPAGLLVAGGCVLVSRVTNFEPGYLYGVIAGVAFTAPLNTRGKGHEAALGALATMSLAVLSWAIWTPVRTAADRAHPSPVLLVADSLLAGLFISGVAGTVITLLPLDFLAGGALIRWHRGAWAATFTVAVFLLVEVMLLPASQPHEHAQAPAITTLGLFLAFGGSSIVFNRYFAARARRREHDQPAPGAGTAVDPNSASPPTSGRGASTPTAAALTAPPSAPASVPATPDPPGTTDDGG